VRIGETTNLAVAALQDRVYGLARFAGDGNLAVLHAAGVHCAPTGSPCGHAVARCVGAADGTDAYIPCRDHITGPAGVLGEDPPQTGAAPTTTLDAGTTSHGIPVGGTVGGLIDVFA
jgi:hypothetical protein